MGKESNSHSHNPYACLLPSNRAIAAAIWKLGLKPEWNTWVVILEEAAAIEERKTKNGLVHDFVIDKVRQDS